LEGYALKPIENLGELVEDANAVILITEKDGNITLTFSQNIGELEVLDILSLVTSEFYLVASDNEGKLH
jgi:Ni2+-binding GTPase involved in maturation of urease and hydrogenase